MSTAVTAPQTLTPAPSADEAPQNPHNDGAQPISTSADKEVQGADQNL
jgi:hypothetical protein